MNKILCGGNSAGKVFAQCIEEVAFLEAKRTGFDMDKEGHALARMVMVVLSSKELRDEALDLLKEKMEARTPPTTAGKSAGEKYVEVMKWKAAAENSSGDENMKKIREGKNSVIRIDLSDRKIPPLKDGDELTLHWGLTIDMDTGNIVEAHVGDISVRSKEFPEDVRSYEKEKAPESRQS